MRLAKWILVSIPLWVGGYMFMNCSGTLPLGYSNFSDAIEDLPEGTSVDVLDSDFDGMADGIDTNGDGEPDIIIHLPTAAPTPTPDPEATLTPTPPPGTTPTPTPVLRVGGEGACLPSVGSVCPGLPPSQTCNGYANVFLPGSTHGKPITYDFQGATMKRIILGMMTGNGNSVEVRGANMIDGFCNEKIAGNSNYVKLTSTSAYAIDLLASRGGSNSVDSLFVPTGHLKYNISGNNNCVSFPTGTSIHPSSSQGGSGSNAVKEGTTCR